MMKQIIPLILILGIAACTGTGTSNEDSSSEMTSTDSLDAIDGRVFFVNIENGDTLRSPFLLEMGVEGMLVEPKGPVRAGYGHHHLLINDAFAERGYVIVADSTHVHYGGGQTSDSVVLEPGNHLLTLQFADGQHVSFGEKWSQSVNVTISE